MELVEFGPDDPTACEAWAAIRNAGLAIEAPWQRQKTGRSLALEMAYGDDGDPHPCYLGHADGRPVVAAGLHYGTRDNLDSVWTDLHVHPDHRRRGLGSEALAELEERTRALGRNLVGADGWTGSGAAEFAAARGYEHRSVGANRQLRLDHVDVTRLDSLRDGARSHADGYELVRCAGRTPDDLVEALATAVAAINDAPLDDLAMEDEVFDADRVRAYEDSQARKGHRLYRLLARHRDTGAVAGHTTVAVDAEDPTWADQHDTSVVRAHRGHRLGLLLKAEMMHWLAENEPDVRVIDTWNAASNDPMIAVNDLLGYRLMGTGDMFQRRL